MYEEDATKIPDDLQVYEMRGENQLSIASVEATLRAAKEASASRLLAIEYADRVLREHPDNPVAAKLKQSAAALAY